MLSRTDAAGHTTKLTYDGKGNVLSVTDALGQTTTMTYNERNKLLSQTNPAGEKTSYDYDGKSNLIAVFLPNGNTINYDYDLSDRVIQIWDNMGVIAKYTYDGNGNRITITDGMERTVNYAYDGLNRRTIETLPSGAVTRYTYDANSNLLTVTDALNNVTSYTYSSLNQQLSHIDALNAKTTFEYDGNGNLVKATDARNNATTWTYDALNRNTQISFANGTSLQYRYDVLGNVIESKDRAGNATKYTYDVVGNLLSKTYADNTRDEFGYDAVGQMLKAVNKNATVQFVYDKAGRLLSETLNGKTMSYGYDIANGLRSYTYPSGMKVEEHLNVRDLINNIMQNGSEAVAMAYNVAGQKTSQTYANGITTNYEYNENGWLSRIADDAKILDLAMTYDALGNITQRKDGIDETQTENYGYDAISQLVSFKRGSAVDKTYQFDLLGNRVKTVENGITTNYTANNVNAYTSITGGLSFTPQYDDNGNLLNDDKHTYVYDLNNRMVSADNDAVIFKYDALGRRIAKNDTYYYYRKGTVIESEKGNDVISFIKGNFYGENLALISGRGNLFYHCNHLGSIEAITNNEGNSVERITYDVFGTPNFIINEQNTILYSADYLLFSGYEYDSETGTYYLHARSLNPVIGRFMQHDPLVYLDWFNDYTYVRNKPISYSDFSGYLTLKGGVSYDVCLDNTNPTPTYSNTPKPTYISAPKPKPTYISAPKPKPTYISASPEAKKPSQPMPNLKVEAGGCIAKGVGLCASVSRGVDKDGYLYESFEISPVVGYGASGSVSSSVGNDNPNYGFDTGFKFKADVELKRVAGANYTGTYSTMNSEGSSTLEVNAFGAGATVNTGGTGNLNVSGGGGMSVTAGPYFSWTWKVK